MSAQADAALSFDRAGFTYAGAREPALADVSLSVPAGQCVVLTGGSGCGKTTLTRLANGLIPVSYDGELAGSVRIAGKDAGSWEMDALCRRVGSVFQNPRSQFFNLDTTSEVAFGCENLGLSRAEMHRRVDGAFALLGIEHLRDRDIRALSGGQRQMVAIASVCAMGPDVFVLDEPTAGTVRLDGHELGKIREKDAAAFRRDNLGFVFQEFNLLDTFTLEDNIYLPLVLMGMSYENMRARLLPVARELGLTELLKKYPYEVSGGQKQRAAVARAIITEPKLLLADEPTGALDSGSTDELLRLFAAINRAGQTILMVTHSVKAASRAGRVLFIKDGQVFHQLYRGEDSDTRFYQRISDTLTMLQSGGEPA